MPYGALLEQLARTTGHQVFQGNLRYSLAQAFGADASIKAQAYLGVSPVPLGLLGDISGMSPVFGVMRERCLKLRQDMMWLVACCNLKVNVEKRLGVSVPT